jgi:hypothetical protein
LEQRLGTGGQAEGRLGTPAGREYPGRHSPG